MGKELAPDTLRAIGMKATNVVVSSAIRLKASDLPDTELRVFLDMDEFRAWRSTMTDEGYQVFHHKEVTLTLPYPTREEIRLAIRSTAKKDIKSRMLVAFRSVAEAAAWLFSSLLFGLAIGRLFS